MELSAYGNALIQSWSEWSSNAIMKSVRRWSCPSGRAIDFEEMGTRHASGQQICVQKLGNAYQQIELGKRMTHFKAPSTEYRFVRTLHALLPCFCVKLDFYA